MEKRKHESNCGESSAKLPRRGRYNELTLKEKIEVIRYAEHNGERTTARKFGIGKTTVNNLKKRRFELFKLLEEQSGSELSHRMRHSTSSDINRLTYDWFLRIKANNVRINKAIIQHIAREFARRLNLEEFKASKNWLELFLKRNEISLNSLSSDNGTAGDCSSSSRSNLLMSHWPTEHNDVVINEMHSQFFELTQGYRPEDIFNAAECSLFYRLTPEQMATIQDFNCQCGELADERLTILLASSMIGDKLKPLVIGVAAKPKAFQNISDNDLPVIWRADKRSWMTCELFADWLKIINREMIKVKRKILLFIDDSPVHPKLNDFSNISLKFLPANAVATVQPMDMGLITAFKTSYRKFMLSYAIVYPMTTIETDQSSFLVSNAVNELDAIYWIERAWYSVDRNLVQRCFKMADFKFIKPETVSDDDDYNELDDHNAVMVFPELPALGTYGYDVNEYVSCDMETSYCCPARSEEDIFEDVLRELTESIDVDPLDVTKDLQAIENQLERSSQQFSISPGDDAPVDLTNEQISQMLDTIIHSAAVNCPGIVPLISKARIEINQLICDKQKHAIDKSLDFCLQLIS